MFRGNPLDAKDLRDLSFQLESFGYESVLLTFHSDSPDYLVKSAAALVPGQKLKYMVALRPYHISPQYCAMVTEAFNQIEPGRLIFNWIAGDEKSTAGEKPQMDVYGDTEALDSIVKRTTFLRNFIKQYNEMPVISKKPEMVFSGFSEYTIETARMFSETSLSVIDDYKNNMDRFKGIKKIMVMATPVILETEKEVEDYKEYLFKKSSRFLDMSTIGTRDSVKKQLLELEKYGISDVLINTHRWDLFGKDSPLKDKDDILINDLIKEINTEIGKK
jgi:alkanesulfonate monooxygenase SsuD/methylene tetrahydromethanopterin reductase-like flavin-dependent oxidoreductase (luciferase family)